MVGGVTPGKGGQKDANGLPIFNTVEDAVKATGANATMVFVPPPFAGDGILEAADAGIDVICAITEGIPTQGHGPVCEPFWTRSIRRRISSDRTVRVSSRRVVA